MKKNLWIWGLGMAGLALTACNKFDMGGSGRELKTQKDRVSYGIGQDIGRSFKQQSVDIKDLDLKKLVVGIEDVLEGKKSAMTDVEFRQTMMAFQQQVMARRDSVNRIKGEENLKAGEAFLAKNSREPGVVSLPNGLQYIVLKEGSGKKPDSNSTVTVHYRGTLIDGTEFDNSIARGQPATFPLKGVIRGWTAALQLMPVGSKWKIFMPPSLAYGPSGAGDKIGPNSTLIFEVELLSAN